MWHTARVDMQLPALPSTKHAVKHEGMIHDKMSRLHMDEISEVETLVIGLNRSYQTRA